MTQSESHPSQQSQFQQPVTRESDMPSQPETHVSNYRASGKLQGRVALITGGDSGIGHAVAVAFAKEGADVAIAYLNEHKDARDTKRDIEAEGRRCEIFPGDLGDPKHCKDVVRRTVKALGRLDILVN